MKTNINCPFNRSLDAKQKLTKRIHKTLCKLLTKAVFYLKTKY